LALGVATFEHILKINDLPEIEAGLAQLDSLFSQIHIFPFLPQLEPWPLCLEYTQYPKYEKGLGAYISVLPILPYLA
jgi:hypothetical protein